MKQNIIFLKMMFSIIFLISILNSIQAGCTYETELSATLKENGNFLSWSTEKETNNQQFVIERSLNGIDFEIAGKVNGAGNSKKVNEYSFTDLNKISKYTRYFYRLVQTDFDGVSEFSHVVILTRTEKDQIFELTSMNSGIIDRYLNINLKSTQKGELTYNLQTNMGVILLKGKVDVTKGENAISLDLDGMDTGNYQFALKVKNEISIMRVKKVDSSELPALNLATKNKRN